MKTKKLISALLAICLLFSLLPALGLSAAAIEVQTLYFCSFETDEELKNWQFLDADHDEKNWRRYGNGSYELTGATDGVSALVSWDYDNSNSIPLTPDNWAYTPEITIPAFGDVWLSYYVFAQDPSYPAEHYSVYASIPGEGETMLFSETLKEGEDRNNPALRSIDLSAYAGRSIRIAFRHHDVSDEFAIGIDEVKVERTVPRDIEGVSVYVDEPVLDMPVTNASDVPEGYYGYTVANVSWEPNDTAFQADKSYSVIVTLEAEEDYVFSSSVSPYINERSAQIITRSPQELKIAYTFPKLQPPMPSMFFDDVKPSHWFYKDVEYVYYNRLMTGTGANKFSPQLTTTRGMIVTILYRMEGSPAVSGNCPFTDVQTGRYYEKPIIWAAQNNIVNGVSPEKFNPEANVTREQMATILCRYAKAKGIFQEDDCIMLAGFTDNDKTSNYARESMSWAVGAGLIGGVNKTDGLYLLPKDNATRCQVAAILHRFCTNFS